MPCYNEEAIVSHTAVKLIAAFRAAELRLQLVAVDNGSKDRTGAILAELAAQYPEVTPHRVEVNQGYGFGVLSGLPVGVAPWVGIIPCDGQVDPLDVVQLYEAAVASGTQVIAKVRRRFRLDGFRRKVVSVCYNVFVRLMWPSLQSIDLNGSPKLFPRELLPQLQLNSRGWLLDPELMIKAHYLGVPVMEYNIFARMRGAGVSHVRPAAMLEFFQALLAARFTGRWRPAPPPVTAAPPVPSASRSTR
jgi:glycosyltransferase involved in cell wall biosynthesis